MLPRSVTFDSPLMPPHGSLRLQSLVGADDAISPPPPTLSSRALRQTSAAIAAAYHRSQAQLVARARWAPALSVSPMNLACLPASLVGTQSSDGQSSTLMCIVHTRTVCLHSAIKREREEAEVVGAQHLRPRVVSWGTAPAAADERRDLRWAVVRKRQLMEDTRYL